MKTGGLFEQLHRRFVAEFEETGLICKRYRQQYGTVTMRDRDSLS